MGVDEDRKKNYAINKQILTTGTVDSNEKYAWRSQAATFQNLCRNVSTVEREEVLEQRFNKFNYEHRTDFLQRRAKAVDSSLENFQKPAKPQTSHTPDIEISDSDGIKNPYADARCSGRCQSSRYNEMNEDALRKFQDVNRSKDCSSINPSALEHKLISKNKDELTETATPGKNTLSAFLTAKPTLRNPQGEGVHANPIDYSNVAKQQHQQPSESTEPNHKNLLTFRTAREILLNTKKKNDPSNRVKSYYQTEPPLFNYASTKKSLGARRAVNSNFVLPLRTDDSRSATTSTNSTSAALTMNHVSPISSHTLTSTPPEAMAPMDPRLANIDPKMVELITNEIMHKNQSVDWNDIAGLDYAKSIIKEAVVYPLLRPDIFTGLRRPPRGILLFGPPGTGKTLIGKCIASKSKSTFFSISASSLTSKWVGDGEKMVRALFAVAAVHQPSVVFIDEIDSLLSQRSENEHESSRRLKTEFLVQLDGAATSDDDRILIVGATNRPHELDEAARRRLVRRLYIPLPEIEARIQILANLLKTVRNNLTSEEIRKIGELTEGYSGSDMESLCREAAMEPIRSIPADEILVFKVENVRPIMIEDFRVALLNVRPSVSPNDLTQYEDWNRIYGAGK